jgi:hypothetical protein
VEEGRTHPSRSFQNLPGSPSKPHTAKQTLVPAWSSEGCAVPRKTAWGCRGGFEAVRGPMGESTALVSHPSTRAAARYTRVCEHKALCSLTGCSIPVS